MSLDYDRAGRRLEAGQYVAVDGTEVRGETIGWLEEVTGESCRISFDAGRRVGTVAVKNVKPVTEEVRELVLFFLEALQVMLLCPLT